mmetsp:Transcript_38980/g.103595  ORF Transcript_38980/g.103595 Transcript_38980/m.103595 type:complete len:313 (-) Transcript_38980:547-1485(-)
MKMHTRWRVVPIHRAAHHEHLESTRSALLLSARQVLAERDAHWKLATSPFAKAEKLVECRMVAQDHNGWAHSVDHINKFEGGALRQKRPNMVAQRETITEKSSIEARFRIHIVTLRIHHQRVDPVIPEILNVVSTVLGRKAGEHTREVQDVRRSISENILTVDTHNAAIWLQLCHTYGKQLHDLSRKVLVREETVVVVRGTPGMRQILSHEGTERHLLQYIPKIEEGVPHKDVVIRQVHFIQTSVEACSTHDKNLGQSPRRALAQLVHTVDGLRSPHCRLHQFVRFYVRHAVVPRPLSVPFMGGHKRPLVSF